jgi:hypothetical protein
VCTIRFVGRERKGDMLADRPGVEYDIVDEAQFARTAFGDALSGIEDERIEFLRGLLPVSVGLLDSLVASVTFDDVEVVLQA